MADPIRRVVTSHDAAGRSIFIMDGTPPVTVDRGNTGVAVTELWETRATPASNLGDAEVTDHSYRLAPPKNGSVFRIVEYQPDSKRRQGDHAAQFAAMHAAEARKEGTRHFGFHQTHTVDYAIVLSGEVYALMDEGEVLLKAGDVLIQRGTSHAWSNRTDQPVRIAFVLIDAEPVNGAR